MSETPERQTIVVDEYMVDSLRALAAVINGALPIREQEEEEEDEPNALELFLGPRRHNQRLPMQNATIYLLQSALVEQDGDFKYQVPSLEGATWTLQDSFFSGGDPAYGFFTVDATLEKLDDGRTIERYTRWRTAENVGVLLTFADGLRVALCLRGDEGYFTCICASDDKQVMSARFEQIEIELRAAHPFRGKHIVYDTNPEVVPLSPLERSQLFLSDEVWSSIDRDVSGLYTHMAKLRDAGLRSNRGVLLYGPPGCGKTAMGRVLATELHGETTVIVPTTFAVQHYLEEVYQLAGMLAPSLVILEDLDLVAGQRKSGRSATLQKLLTVLDGAGSTMSGVVTVASTNDPNGIDPAARRSARFDTEIAIRPPNESARKHILEGVLARLGYTFEPKATAVAADGFSGSDLQEVVTNGLLAYGDELDDVKLAKIAIGYAAKAHAIAEAFAIDDDDEFDEDDEDLVSPIFFGESF